MLVSETPAEIKLERGYDGGLELIAKRGSDVQVILNINGDQLRDLVDQGIDLIEPGALLAVLAEKLGASILKPYDREDYEATCMNLSEDPLPILTALVSKLCSGSE